MIQIDKIINNSVFYRCSCGIYGKCIFKSFSSEGPSLLNLRCPSCGATLVFNVGDKIKTDFEEDVEYSLSIELSNFILDRKD